MEARNVGYGIPSACIQEAFEASSNAGNKGISSFYTPLFFGKAVGWRLPSNRDTIVDLTCGDGRLLIGVANETTRNILGADIDPCHTFKNERDIHLNKIIGDLGKVAPLLDDVRWRADLFALNPPFDCHWSVKAFEFLGNSDLMDVRAAYRVGPVNDHRCAKGTFDSTIATLLTALSFCSERGEGVMIANADTLDRLIFNFDAPYKNVKGRIWHYDKFKGNPMTGSDTGNFGKEFTTGIIYFARQHTSGCPKPLTHDSVEDMTDEAKLGFRRAHRSGTSVGSPGHYWPDTGKLWQAVKDEYRQISEQARKKQFNIWLNPEGKIATQLSVYEQNSIKVDKELAKHLFELNDRRPMELVMQRAQRQALLSVVNGGIWKVHPDLPKQVDDAIRQYNAVRAPLHPLSEIQRLGYLDEQDMVTCQKDLQDPLTRRVIFRSGEHYPLRTQTVRVERLTERPDSKGMDCDFLLSGNELAIFIKDATGKEQCFMDARLMTAAGVEIEDVKPNHPLQVIAEHFEIPNVPDVADCDPKRFQENLAELDRIISISRSKQALKGFQRTDIARAAMSDGLIGAWQTGLGKTRKSLLWPLLKVGCEQGRVFPKGRVLLVAPENLHQQMEDEAREVFGVGFIKLDSIDTYNRMKPLNSGFYIASFTQVASNGVSKMPDPSLFIFDGTPASYEELAAMMLVYNVGFEDAKNAKFPDELDGTKTYTPVEKIVRLCKDRLQEFGEGVGQEVGGIRCVYSPCMADIIRKEFDCVVFDEGTKLKGEDTQIGAGCRLMAPRYRMVLTATPIKNRLPDIFWLAQWVAGGHREATPRWPYTMEPGEQDRFAAEFLVTERNLTKERQADILKGKAPRTNKELRKKKRGGKVTADVCNIHRLWKLLAPNILRKRKADIGEYLVPMVFKPVRVPMGEKQALTYKYHLSAVYTDRNGNPVILPQLQALRSCAAAPNSGLLTVVPHTMMVDDDRKMIPDCDRFFRSESDYTPKLAAALNIIADCMARGEQVVAFSAFHEPLDTLSRRLAQAGVPFDCVDGRSSPKARGVLASHFKKGLPHAKPVLLAGMNAMAEGNSWHHCNNVIILAYDWAMNLFEQAINRVHRLNSYRPVNVYTVICDGTIDRRLESLTDEKGDSAELVLDGQLIGEQIEEVNFRELLKFAIAEFSNVKTVPEEHLESEWETLRDRLADSFRDNCGHDWQKKKPVIEVEAEPEYVPKFRDESESEGLDILARHENVAVAVVDEVVKKATDWF